MAKVQLQNQTFSIPEELIALDQTTLTEKGEAEAKRLRESNLKRWLSQVSPAATNATLEWSEESTADGSKETVIKVKPQLGTKGGAVSVSDALIERLSDLPQYVNPLHVLTFELKVLEAQGRLDVPLLQSYEARIRDVLEHTSSSSYLNNGIVYRLTEARAVASPWVPLGF